MNRRKILDRVEEQMPLIQSVITHQLNRTASVLLEKFRRILLRRFRGCHNAFGTHGTCLSRLYLPNNSSRSLFYGTALADLSGSMSTWRVSFQNRITG